VKKNMVKNQYHDLDSFLHDVDMVVIMVGHSEIKDNQEKLGGKIVFDTRKVINREKVYRL
jgi:UDP-N-acetyl-D-mannosaminuronic acid dehydrogenase